MLLIHLLIIAGIIWGFVELNSATLPSLHVLFATMWGVSYFVAMLPSDLPYQKTQPVFWSAFFSGVLVGSFWIAHLFFKELPPEHFVVLIIWSVGVPFVFLLRRIASNNSSNCLA